MVREGAKRAAMNMPIQGTEADLMKLAALKLERELPEATQIMQVHDSIIFEVDEKNAEGLAQQAEQIMENIHKLPVKLEVDYSIANNWGDL